MDLQAAPESPLIADAWAAVVSGSEDPPSPVPPELLGDLGHLPSHLAVQPIATACVAAALTSACELERARGGSPQAPVLDRRHVSVAVQSERFFRDPTHGAPASFAPLSRFWRASDGWVRTHANYAWHRAALLDAIGARDDVRSVADGLAERRAVDVEEVVFKAGGIATAVRSWAEWQEHPQGRAVLGEPLIAHERSTPGSPRRRSRSALPAAGLRVLDLTRVIAGPVATSLLGALGASVLRLDPPRHPDMAPGTVADSLLGKRSAALDASTREGLIVLHELLDEADVLVCGYRPGSLGRFGLDPEALTERHPGLVITILDAWGHRGPWAGRRGFDSVVQAPTGIALAESADGTAPGALPCQLLDHGTGYLAAAAALDGVRRQITEGGTHVRRVSLARTAAWLMSTTADGAERPAPEDVAPSEWLTELQHPRGSVTAVRPPGVLDGRPLRWPAPPTGYTDDPAAWPTLVE